MKPRKREFEESKYVRLGAHDLRGSTAVVRLRDGVGIIELAMNVA